MWQKRMVVDYRPKVSMASNNFDDQKSYRGRYRELARPGSAYSCHSSSMMPTLMYLGDIPQSAWTLGEGQATTTDQYILMMFAGLK